MSGNIQSFEELIDELLVYVKSYQHSEAVDVCLVLLRRLISVAHHDAKQDGAIYHDQFPTEP